MKPELPQLDQAFPPMPEDLRQRILQTARSVKEEEPMKKVTLRTVLIAALIAVIALSAALAAGELLGWTDFFAVHYGVQTPPALQEAAAANPAQTFTVGPMTADVQELVCDGHIVLMSTHFRTTDGSEALYCQEPWDAIGAWGDRTQEPARLGLDPMTSWVDAARQKGLPLYTVRALLEPGEAYLGEEAMEDLLWNADGTAVAYSMPSLNPEASGAGITGTIFLSVCRIDPESGEIAEEWSEQREVTLPTAPVLTEKIYKPAQPVTVAGLNLTEVRAELRATGAYFCTVYTAPEGMEKPDEIWELESAILDGDARLADAEGKRLPIGLSLSAGVNTDGWPQVILTESAALSKLPETLLLNGEASCELK